MVTHSMENILSMQQYYAAPPSGDEGVHSPPSRKRRCLAKEQDPMSHRIIEKRRRDRMNNCLADLSRLIPVDYLKKGRGRIEKTEIIEMAIRHMKYLQDSHTDVKPQQQQQQRQQQQQQQQQQSTLVQHGMHAEDSVDSVTHTTTSQLSASAAAEHYRLGYQECISETMNFLVEVEGCYARDSLCVQLISHLQQHCDKILGTNASGDASSNSSGSNSFLLGNSKPNMSGLPIVNHNNNNSHTQNNNSNSNQQSPQMSSLSSSFDSGDSCHHLQLQQQPSFNSDDSNHSFESPQQQQLQQRPTTYKFKNSIKQRFSADQRVKSTSSCSASPPPSASVSSSCSSDCKSPQQQSSPQPQSHQGVPIFALHDNGGYYVPLTLEASVLRPHLSCCQPHQTSGCSAEVTGQEAVLHPVTISVNFSHPSSVPSWTPAHSPSSPQMALHHEQRQQ